jgi:hypothetical protein
MITFQGSGMSDLAVQHGRSFPFSPSSIEWNQEVHLTEEYNSKILDFGSSIEFIQVVLTGLTRDNYQGSVNGLRTWFMDSNINGAETSFTFIDENNETHTVRLWQTKINFQLDGFDSYSVSFVLKKEA